ncbi:MAG: TonB-dependent receptor [Gammaproteobacteria bacterium]|nr:TonB-dependent receptor [Gammaproteobacteria bacterium]
MASNLRPASQSLLGLAVTGLCLSPAGIALAADDSEALKAVVVVGTRFAGHSADESLAPVDVVTTDDMRQSAALPGEVGAALQSLVPSFNLPRQSNSDFADLVRPAQLRGLSPDQTLVLVNGKRRHGTATLTTESKLGKGTSPVDLNTIPEGAIERIEVLRDGAGAQYGSDAIAGVINIVLKNAADGGEATITAGQNRTDFKPTGKSITDGDTLFVSTNAGFGIGQDGFLNLTAEYRDRDQTLRSGPDQIPFFENQTPPNLALLGTQTHKAGDGPTEDINLMYNSAFGVGDSAEFYSFGSYSHREGEGANFFRYPDSWTNVPSIFPDGYIPVLDATVDDFSLAAGARGSLASDWAWDLSAVYGSNNFDHNITNSLNPSLGAASQTSFNIEELKLTQWDVRFDMTRPFEVGWFTNPLNFAWGLEYRLEAYKTKAGDLESYQRGPVSDVPVGTEAGAGLQPDETVDVDRNAFSAYVDFESDITDKFQLGLAGRFEDYSDFGNSVNGKLSARYEFSPVFAVRGTVGTGFRAPSLTQSFFRGSTTSFGDLGQLEQVLNLPTDDPIAQLLGAQDLKAEKSVSYNLGFVVRTDAGFRLTFDYYRVNIDNRITLSERIGGDEVTDFIDDSLGIPDVQSVRFFTNAVDTETKGFDIVAEYGFDLSNSSLTFSAAYNKSETDVIHVDPNPAVLDSLDVGTVLFGAEEQNTLETAAPDDKLILTGHWSSERWSILGRATRWGEAKRVFSFYEPGPEQVYGSEWGVDLDVEYQVTKGLKVALGGNNIFDEYPDLSSSDINYFGNLPYDVLQPISFNGAFYYLRGTYSF